MFLSEKEQDALDLLEATAKVLADMEQPPGISDREYTIVQADAVTKLWLISLIKRAFPAKPDPTFNLNEEEISRVEETLRRYPNKNN